MSDKLLGTFFKLQATSNGAVRRLGSMALLLRITYIAVCAWALRYR